MDYFKYHKNQLFCEGVEVADLVKRYGTPLYVYSSKTILEHYQRLKEAFPSALICYSLKANSNLSICRLLKGAGAGFDVVSGGELYRALKAGADPAKIVFAGVGKSEEEIEYALKSNILMLNAESFQEVQSIEQVAQRLKRIASVSLRINPAIEAHTHRYLKTAVEESKFGFSIPDAQKAIREMNTFGHIRLIGLHLHIGSQITETAPYLKALRKVLPIVDYARLMGHPVEYLDIGGGFGIFYKGVEAKPARVFGEVIMPALRSRRGQNNVKLIMEPGRFIVGNAGILLTRVVRTKTTGRRQFVICDAGMNTLIRPALYEAYHRIEFANDKIRLDKKTNVDIAGPICESGDFFGKNRLLVPPKRDDLLAIFSAGAYGYSMASTYNSRPRPAEVLVDGKRHKLITRAETYQDLIRLEL